MLKLPKPNNLSFKSIVFFSLGLFLNHTAFSHTHGNVFDNGLSLTKIDQSFLIHSDSNLVLYSNSGLEMMALGVNSSSTDKNRILLSKVSNVTQTTVPCSSTLIGTTSRTVFNAQNKIELKCATDQTAIIEVMVSGGYGNYSYSWTKNGTVIAGENQNLIDDLGVGVYELTVRDSTSSGTSSSTQVCEVMRSFKAFKSAQY